MSNTAQYDLNVILTPNLSEAQVQSEKDAIDQLIERYQGTQDKLDEWGNQRLAYPIRKFNEGYYLIYRLTLPVDSPKTIEGSLRQRDNVMRVLVVKDRPEWRTQKQAPEAPADEAATPAS